MVNYTVAHCEFLIERSLLRDKYHGDIFVSKMWLQSCSTINLGPCLFYDQLIMERNYTLYLNGTWTVFKSALIQEFNLIQDVVLVGAGVQT